MIAHDTHSVQWGTLAGKAPSALTRPTTGPLKDWIPLVLLSARVNHKMVRPRSIWKSIWPCPPTLWDVDIWTVGVLLEFGFYCECCRFSIFCPLWVCVSLKRWTAMNQFNYTTAFFNQSSVIEKLAFCARQDGIEKWKAFNTPSTAWIVPSIHFWQYTLIVLQKPRNE